MRRGAGAGHDRRQRRGAAGFDHVIERDVLVSQPGESWIRPGRAVPVPRRGRPRSSSALRRARLGGVAAASQVADPEAVGERPLTGVKVLDFTAFWAGPAATAWLSRRAPT